MNICKRYEESEYKQKMGEEVSELGLYIATLKGVAVVNFVPAIRLSIYITTLPELELMIALY